MNNVELWFDEERQNLITDCLSCDTIAVIRYLAVTCYSVVLKCTEILCLTHRGRVTHICVSKLNSIGLDNGLSPARRQAIN